MQAATSHQTVSVVWLMQPVISVKLVCEQESGWHTFFLFFFFPLWGWRANNGVNEKESHLGQREVCSFTSVISCCFPSFSGSTSEPSSKDVHRLHHE